MTDKTNVITISQENLDWMTANIPGRSKKARLEYVLDAYRKSLQTSTGTAAAPAAGGA